MTRPQLQSESIYESFQEIVRLNSWICFLVPGGIIGCLVLVALENREDRKLTRAAHPPDRSRFSIRKAFDHQENSPREIEFISELIGLLEEASLDEKILIFKRIRKLIKASGTLSKRERVKYVSRSTEFQFLTTSRSEGKFNEQTLPSK